MQAARIADRLRVQVDGDGVLSNDELTSNGPLPEWKEIDSVGQNKQTAYLKNIAYGFMGLAAIGLLALLSSFFIKVR